IVAVFFPVALMPGIAGQFFKNFGLTVVVSVLMSLAVARMITPMIAAYFLQAKGHAPHAEGGLMDRYMSVLRWSIDATRGREIRSALQTVPMRGPYLALPFAAAIAAVAWGISEGGWMIVLAVLLAAPIAFALAFL